MTAYLVETKKQTHSDTFLYSFHYFRSIAIIIIVAGHCLSMLKWQPRGLAEETFLNLITGGTSLFIFISGFLFHHIFYRKFRYKKFISKKIKNVGLPYLCMSIFPITLALIQKSIVEVDLNTYFFAEGHGLWIDYLRPTLLLLGTGKVTPAYWYIPFAIILFGLSPLFIQYINLRSRLRNILIVLTLLIAMIIHRPIYNLDIYQSILYFLPVYLIGIQVSIHRHFIYKQLKNKEIYILMLAIFFAFLQSALFDTVGNFHKSAFSIGEIDIMLIQKCLLCIFFIVFLHRFESKNIPPLSRIASASFAIYFIHPQLLRVLQFSLKYWTSPLSTLLTWSILTPLVILCCYLIANTIKQRFPNTSRMVIGW